MVYGTISIITSVHTNGNPIKTHRFAPLLHKKSGGNAYVFQLFQFLLAAKAVLQSKHNRIYKHLASLVKNGGLFVCNVKNHIRKGKEIDVKSFHEESLKKSGFQKTKEIFVESKGNGFGANADKRTTGEYIMVFQKI